MSLRRISVLLSKELITGPKSFFFVWAVAGPISLTLFVHLIFGSLFSGKPKLGIKDHGNSQIVESLQNMESLSIKEYTSEIKLKNAVETGARDVGIVILQDFDSMIKNGELTKLTAYVWGESLLKNRSVVTSALLYRIREISGKKAPVDITPVSLGNEKNIPWEDRFLPFIVLMAIFMGGFIIPASSLVGEKEKRTIGAVIITPATKSDVFISKGLMGMIVSMITGIMILVLNRAFNVQFGLIIFILFLGAAMASCIGLMVGAFMKDIASLFSTMKGFGLILYGPGLIYIFPKIPKWVGKLFPTYYVINPILEITQKGGSWSTVHLEVFILIGIIAAFFPVVGVIANKTRLQEA